MSFNTLALPHTLGTEGNLPYYKKEYFMTRSEHEFFKILQRIVDENYYIFPQVNLDKIIYSKGKQSYKNPYYNKVARKSVDFVLFDKIDISPVLAIELDDPTHEQEDRKERDEFVDKVFAHCGISILHLHEFLREEVLKKMIIEKIRGYLPKNKPTSTLAT